MNSSIILKGLDIFLTKMSNKYLELFKDDAFKNLLEVELDKIT